MATVTITSKDTGASVIFNRVNAEDAPRLVRELPERCSSWITIRVGPNTDDPPAVRFVGNGIYFSGGHCTGSRIGMGVGWMNTPSIVFAPPAVPVRQSLLRRALRLFRR